MFMPNMCINHVNDQNKLKTCLNLLKATETTVHMPVRDRLNQTHLS